MAILFPLTDEWWDWFEERPDIIKRAAERYPPNRLYRMDSGHRGTIACYSETSEGVRVMIDVTGEYNQIAFPRRVFGIDPATLVECDLPEPGEPLGVLLKPDEIDDYIATLRRERGH